MSRSDDNRHSGAARATNPESRSIDSNSGSRCDARNDGETMIPGELFIKDGEIELNAGRKTVTLTVANTGDRPIQVGSHYHFFETNPALKFDRKKARGMRLDIAAGTAVRFEPGQTRDVQLVALAGQARRLRLPRRRDGQAVIDCSRSGRGAESCPSKSNVPSMPTCSGRPPATGCGLPTPISSSRSRRISPSTARR